MRRVHSFVVPHRERLLNARGLFAQLQEKVHRRRRCLFCHRAFGSAEACRSHMRDKGHCRIDCETPAGALELGAFYDEGLWNRLAPPLGPMCAVAEAADSLIESLWPSSAARRRSGDAGDDACELVLADGTRLGHRSLHAYYRQKFRPDDGRLTVRTNLREGHLTWLRARRQRAALEARLATREAARARYRLLVRGAAAAKGGTSKALAAQSNFKASFADNKHARALMHHGYGGFGGGAHYTMAGSKQFQRGVRVKGVVSRHSRQAAKRNGQKQQQQQQQQRKRKKHVDKQAAAVPRVV